MDCWAGGTSLHGDKPGHPVMLLGCRGIGSKILKQEENQKQKTTFIDATDEEGDPDCLPY
jgi:hypothetical protein